MQRILKTIRLCGLFEFVITSYSIHYTKLYDLLIGDAEKRISDAGVEEIVGTDSVPGNISKVSLAPLISQALKGAV